MKLAMKNGMNTVLILNKFENSFKIGTVTEFNKFERK